MKSQVLHSALWTVAFSVLFFWLISFAAIGLTDAQHNPTIYHYKLCPAQAKP